MAANSITGLNQVFPIYNQDGTPFNDMVLHKASVNSVVMSLGDKITGEAYYRNNSLNLTMLEYIVYNGVKYTLVNPPTIIREGLVNDNSELKGMTKYSFEFYHPMYLLSNFPFTDVATKSGEEKYLSQNKTFSWIGKPQDYIDKLNKNLEGTQWYVRKSSKFPQDKDNELSEVLTFDNVTIADAIKTGYETWDIPYIVSEVSKSDPLYAQNKRFVVEYGLPSNKIYASEADRQTDNPYVFRFGQGVGLKNNSRTPRNNKIVTRLAGYGSEKNIPYGYPQIVWDGDEDDPRLRYPLYDGIVGGRYVKLIQHPFTRNHLMPSVYTDAVNKKVNPNATGYNPNIELKDYYDAVGGDYPNQINPLAPSYEIHEFEDIKPEMNDGTSNVEILGAIPLNADLTPASEWVDDIDGDGNFVQSFFQITLPQLAFDLYACAAITQEMQINMRSGDCIGCTFPIQVDWDDYKLNFYDENGDFAPDGSQRDLSKYPKSNLGSINVIVQKENSTFGTIMPNIYQQPQSGDEFVILGISLPLEYITSAEQRLDEAMQSFLLENNVYYYDYPLKFDEHFLTTHTYILSQIKPNAILRFQYAGQVLGLYVKQLTIKYGTAVLPEYDITLTDNIDVVLNQIGQVAEDVEKLSSIISILRQSYNRNVWTELAKKLSKVSDDTAQGFIRFIQGLQVGNQFVTGLLGEGGVFRKEADGTTYLEADKMYIRIKAYFDNVEIRDYKHSAGNRIASPAGAKCCRVEYIDSNGNVTTNVANAVKFRCYFRGSDGEDEVRNNFVVGDQAYCHITSVDTKDDDPNSKSLNMKHYWRLIVGRNATNVLTENGEHWIDLSNRASETLTIDGTTYTHAGYQSGSDVPAAQDDIIQLGNINDTDRMGAIIEFVTGADAPSYQIFQGINDFNLNGKNYIGLGYSTQTGRAYLNVYGDAYIGDKPDQQGNARSYLKYNAANRQLSIKARIDASSTIDGTDIDEYIAQHSSDWTEEEINALIHDVTDDIQDQIDGAIDTWFYNGTPSDRVLPESEWKAIDIAAGNNNERLRHLGDIYYDNETGYAYRYSNTGTESSPVFVWNPITDSAVVEALRKASQAQDTADGKRTIYGVWNAWMKDGSNILEVGDLFIPQSNTTQGGVTYKANKVYKCTVKGSPTFQEVAYTDDAALINFLNNTYSPFVTQIQGQVDKKAETWYQSTNPATAWTTTEIKNEHIGDIWHNTSSSTIAGVESGRDAIWNGTSWVMSDVPQSVYDTIDGKADIFVSKPSTYNVNDLWIIESTISDTDIPTGCKKGDIVISSTKRTSSYNKADWKKKDRYTDDSAFNGYINAILNGSGSSGDAATVAAAQKAIKDALGGGTTVEGGLLLTSLIAMRKYKGSGSTTDIANYTTWAGISGLRKDTETGTGWKGYGIAAWYGGAMTDHEVSTTATDYAKSLFRFDGSGYLASGNISWDKNGIVTIANVYSNVNGQSVEWSGTSLQYMNNLSNSLPLTYQGGTAYFDPKISFTNLSVMGKTVATQEWVGNNYISINFFTRLFRAYNGNTLVNANDVTSTIDNIKAMFGFWTEQYISSLGMGTDGGGGGVGDVTWDLLANNSDTRQIALSHLTTALSGYVTSVKVGTTAYNPSSGVVSLPAYPTTLPASDVSAWAKASTKPSYTLDEVSDGSTRKLSDYTKTTAFKSLSIQGNGTSVGTYSPTSALTVNIAAGSNISITNDTTNHKITIANTYSYTLPNATTSAKGGVIIGNGLSVSDGKVSLGTSGVTAGTYRSVTVDKYGRVTNGTNPTTLAGYGITDAKIASGVITLGSNTITPVTSVGLSAPTGFSVTNTPVTKTGTLTLSYASGYEGFTTTLKNKINLLYSLFTREGSGTSSDPYVIKANYGLYSESFISALGAGSGGSGGGGVGDVTWDLLANNSDTRQIALSHLTTALSGYATQSWVQSQGYTTNIGTVTSVKVGTTAYNPSSGVVTLPAYITGITSLMVTTALGYTPANSTSLANYLPLSGGTLSNTVRTILTLNQTGSNPVGAYITFSNNNVSRGLVGFNTTVDGVFLNYLNSSGGYISGLVLHSSSVQLELYDPYRVFTLLHSNNVQNNLTSTSATDVLSAYQGYLLANGSARDNTKLPLTGGTLTSTSRKILILNQTGSSGASGQGSYISCRYNGADGADFGFNTTSGSFVGNYNGGNSYWLELKGTSIKYNGWDLIHSNNIGSQRVSYATTAGTATDPTKLPLTGGTLTGSLIISTASYPFDLHTSNTECSIRYCPSGTTGNGRYVNGVVNSGTSGKSYFFMYDVQNATQAFHLENGRLGINNGSSYPSYNLVVGGTFYASGNSSIGGELGVTGTMTVQSIEIGHTNEINATGSTTLHLQYRNTGNLVLCNNGKNVGIGTDSPSQKLHVSGNIYATGAVTCLSDIREKNILGQTEITVEQIAKMRSIVYMWKDNGGDRDEHVGSIAQDWQNVLPQAVLTAKDEKKTLSLQYGVASLVSVITVAKRVVNHEKRIKELEETCERLRTELSRYKVS